MSRSVFVTGGSGLLGVNWAVAIRDRFTVTLGLHDRDISIRGVRAIRTALDSEESLSRAFESADCSMVVHTAGITSVEACEADPARAQLVNVDLAVIVARVCARAGIKFVHISTDHLFGRDGDRRKETDPVSPTNVYGQTKAVAERCVLDAHPDALVVRTNFYGWGPSYRPSFSDMIVDSLRRAQRVTLFHDVWYTPILMHSLVTAVHELVERDTTGIIHIVGDDSVTKEQFGRSVAECFGLDDSLITPISLDDKPELVARPRRMSLSNARATAILNRRLGGLGEHLSILKQQEAGAATKEIRGL